MRKIGKSGISILIAIGAISVGGAAFLLTVARHLPMLAV